MKRMSVCEPHLDLILALRYARWKYEEIRLYLVIVYNVHISTTGLRTFVTRAKKNEKNVSL